MQSESFFVIATVLLWTLLMFALWVIHQQMKANQKQQTEMRQNLNSMANLAAAKDISAFAALESVSMKEMPTTDIMLPMDDQSVARRMQEEYVNAGMDPAFAVNQEDPLADFGGTHSLM